MKNNKLKEIAKMATAAVMSSGPYEWPPSCLLFTYQPVRPELKNVQRENVNAPESKEQN